MSSPGTNGKLPLTSAPLVGSQMNPNPLQPIPSSQTPNPIQTLTPSPGSITQITMDASLLNSGPSGAIVSLPQNFCFPNAPTIGGTGSLSPGVAVASNTVGNGNAAQINTMSLGSVFSMNPSAMAPQFLQPLSVPQQQTLTLPIGQQQPQQPQQNLGIPQSIPIGQNPSAMNMNQQPVPIGQVVCSSVASRSLNFVNPALLTMSSPSAGQNQYITNPFNQFPIMISSQQPMLANMNPAPVPPNLSSQPLPKALPVSEGPQGIPSSQGLTQDQSTVSTISSEKGPELTVDPGIRVVQTTSEITLHPQPSPDTTTISVLMQNNAVSSTSTNTSASDSSDATNTVSSSSARSFIPISSPSTQIVSNSSERRAEGIKMSNVECDTVRSSATDKTCVALASSNSALGSARMKFTPINLADAPGPSGDMEDERMGNPVEDNEDDDDDGEESVAGLMEVDERDSPTLQFQPVGIKMEPFDQDLADYGDDDSKHSPSPIESLELTRKSDLMRDPGFGAKLDTQGELADVEDLDDSEFVWEDYLRETGATAVPPTAFKHVETSLQSGFSKGMKLEAPNKICSNTYWVATVVMTCGPLLRLRYEGYHDNSSADFWSDPMTSDIHPIGWCEENGKTLQPPESVKEKYPDWNKFLAKTLKGAVTAPSYLLDKLTGATPVDQIREGMRLEIQDWLSPDRLWLVRIMENVGGRLLLRYEGLEVATYDFWLFYLDNRLHPIGWCRSESYEYAPPSVVKLESGKTEDELEQLLHSALTDVTNQNLPADIFNDQKEIKAHNFEKGMRLEAVNPGDGNGICPATVVEVVDAKYFIVEIDNLHEVEGKRLQICCSSSCPVIFPVNWAASKGIKLETPPGWKGAEFKWSEYLDYCKASPAPEDLFNLDVPEHEFDCGMKLEAVKPNQPSQICAATITKIVAHLMWIHLDSSRQLMENHVESIYSHNLFPTGWCVSNGYQLTPPQRGAMPVRKRVAVVQPEMAEDRTIGEFSHLQSKSGRELFGGPQIYFNHRCFSGPYLSKGRIAGLPRSVGPGPVTLVMKEVLSMLINTAYKSCRVLRELQLEGRPNPSMTQQMLKAKYKGKSYRAVVEICRTTNQLENFCRHVCIKLECCPNLISPHFISGDCPENCSQLTKTKYTYYYGKRKKKIGRPPGGHSNLENGQKKPGKRRKRKKIGMIAKRSSRPTVEDQGDNLDDDKASVGSDTRTIDSTSTSGSKERNDPKPRNNSNASKRRYTHHIPPPSEIRTRGAKLPKYSFEKRTHKKIMIVEGAQQTSRARKEQSARLPSVTRDSAAIESSFTSMRAEPAVSLKSEPPLKLEKNPLEWTVTEVGEFLQTTDCADRDLVARLKTEEIDGQALLLLTLPNVQEYMGVKLGPAIKLCHLIERIKLAFYDSFAK